uniref:RING-type domain-containing protein n=1 Tax=Alexandrium monilatum TaxID=311494 RepID=A0A7S4Q225_9DINO
MVPSPSDGLPEDLFECGICRDLLLDPVTLSCCGKSFCQDCLRELLLSAASTGTARCPAGCGQKVPFRLPPRSHVLQKCLEAIVPEELARRRQEAAEAEAGEAEALPGGFKTWEEVVAAKDLYINAVIVAAAGAPGVVVGSRTEGRVTVIFDERTDFGRGSINVLPFEIVRQLPRHFGVRLLEPVVAVEDLHAGATLLAHLGTRGIVIAQHGDDRLRVQFDRRADGSENPINVLPHQIQPHRKLLGGYDVGQRVAASQDLFANDQMLVRSGTEGTVHSEYSDARLVVKFDARVDGSPNALNVTPAEVRALEP